MAKVTAAGRVVLVILDGFGIGKDDPHNAIKNSSMPFYRSLLARFPHSKITTHGEEVGLPTGIMGNSEVGHMTLGAGRIFDQDLVKLNKMISDGAFYQNAELKAAFAHRRIHLIGLLSDGGVHSHIEHLKALIEMGKKEGAENVFVHAITDGRDTPPDSAPTYLKQLGQAKIATLIGRYFAMDRDKRWERTEKAYLTYAGENEISKLDPIAAVEASYRNGKTDEFIEPVLFDKDGVMKDGDSIIFFNFRADRARQIVKALECAENLKAGAKFKPALITTFTQYDADYTYPTVLKDEQSENVLGKWLESHDLKQFRVAETEKYAHVTFFFNGGREDPFKGEERVLVPSPRDVPTYDLKPEMSANEIADEAVKRIESSQYSFVLMNFANGDMVGHTGNYEATLKAMETLDHCLESVVGAASKNGFHTLITADHGNAEEMRDHRGKHHTQHTLNPVPLIWIPPGEAPPSKGHLEDGTLADIMPSLLDLMKLEHPKEETGKTLIRGLS